MTARLPVPIFHSGETTNKYRKARTEIALYLNQLDDAREEDRIAAETLVHQADGAIEEVNSYLEESYLTAPSSGIFSNVYPHQGELEGQGSPVMTITDLADIWFTFNIREDQRHAMNVGAVITCT